MYRQRQVALTGATVVMEAEEARVASFTAAAEAVCFRGSEPASPLGMLRTDLPEALRVVTPFTTVLRPVVLRRVVLRQVAPRQVVLPGAVYLVA